METSLDWLVQVLYNAPILPMFKVSMGQTQRRARVSVVPWTQVSRLSLESTPDAKWAHRALQGDAPSLRRSQASICIPARML